MHSVNLDLLKTTPHHVDGRPRDPHAHHRADLLARMRAARRKVWRDRLTRLRAALHVQPAAARRKSCPS